jgi:AcrR family transcriptional regulator
MLGRMARPRPPDRLDAIACTAVELFSARGYRRTQMADVARRLGVSPGSLYGYVESKEALFELALRRAFGEAPRPAPLPRPTPAPGAVMRFARARLLSPIRRSGLDARVRAEPPRDVAAELAGLIGELYDGLAQRAPALRLLERSAPDRPELAKLYFGGARGALIELLRRYLARRIAQGRLAAPPDVAIAARVVLETTAWFAWHRLGDPVPQPMDDDLARETVIAVLSRGLLPGGAR